MGDAMTLIAGLGLGTGVEYQSPLRMPAPANPAAESSPGRDLPDRSTLLERAGPERTAIYTLVRKVIDGLDEVAPWDLLYAPAEDRGDLSRLVCAFMELVEAVPDRVGQLIQSLRSSGMGEQEVEDVDFFFSGIHGMVASDLGRLRVKLAELEGCDESSPAQRAYLCEITADIKGKYTSAVMGAAASLIAEGLWDGIEVEPLLFPEKAAEFQRNDALVSAIDDILSTIEQLPSEVPFPRLMECWRCGERLDRYILADLDRLKSQLGMLLRVSNRRALYSGDFHQIHRRESQLSERLNELESLHRSTWRGSSRDVPPESYERLVQLLLEVSAIIDVDILQRLIGEESCKDLRAVVVAERARGAGSKMGASLSAGLRGLVPLLAEDDLATYFAALRGAVLKRLSLRMMEDGESVESKAGVGDEPSGEVSLQEPVLPVAAGTPVSPSVPEAPTSPLAAAGRKGEQESLSKARARLSELRSTSNPSWKGFLMVERLLSKQGRIPPRMFGLALPFIEELSADLLPLLSEVADFPPSLVERMSKRCRYLRRIEVTPSALQREIPKALRELSSDLEESTAKVTELVVNRSVF